MAPQITKLVPLDDSPDGSNPEEMLILYALHIMDLNPKELFDAIKLHGEGWQSRDGTKHTLE